MVKLHKPIVYQWIAKEVLKKICSPKVNMPNNMKVFSEAS
jgi:hypothetical protein